MPRQELLIDVRSTAEFASGALASHAAPAVNIEHQAIDQPQLLQAVYAAQGIHVALDDQITLYCRSGRRSNLALQRLIALGYRNVRDLGGMDEARAVLEQEREQVKGRAIAKGKDEEEEENNKKKQSRGNEGMAKEDRVKSSFQSLLDGLKELE